MQTYKYIILPLLLIGSTSSLLFGNPDSDNKFKLTFFDRITKRIGNSRLFNRISFETLEKVHTGLQTVTVGLAALFAYKTYELYKTAKELRQDIQKIGKERRQNIKALQKTIKNYEHQLEIEDYKRIIAKQQKLIDE